MPRQPGGIVETLERRALLSAAAATWVDLNRSDLDAGAAAEFTLLNNDLRGLKARVSVPGLWIDSQRVRGRQFSHLDVPGSGTSAALGQPELPVIRRLLAVPEGATVSASVAGQPKTYSLEQLGLKTVVEPAQTPVAKVQGARQRASLSMDRRYYSIDSFGPGATVRFSEAGRASGQRLVMMELSPIQYNPVRNAIRVYSELTLNVKFSGGSARLAGNADGSLLKHIAVNYSGPASGSASQRLLIVAHDSLAAAPSLAQFIAQKQSDGFAVDLADTSTAGATTTAIKSYIKSRYDNSSTRPAAVLLVGDTDLVPQFIAASVDHPDTDLYYSCMDAGDDWLPEFPIGRFSVENATQLDAVVAKSISYETASSGAWLNKAAFLASEDNYSITEGTHNYVISQYLDPAGYTSDKLYTHTYSATTAQVSTAFNEGRMLGVYSGHGTETTWADGPVFTQSNINALANAGKYPVIASFACVTGDYSQGECFAETWQRAANKGAVEILASSVDSYWDEDDILERKLFDAIFAQDKTGIGSAVIAAKQSYLQFWGASAMTRRYFEMYNLFGDPTVQLPGQQLHMLDASPLDSAFTGESYTNLLQAAGGQAPYSWSLMGGSLPDGLILDDTGSISGTPSNTGTWTFTAQVSDGANAATSREFELSVVPRMLVAPSSTLPAAPANLPYSISLSTTGGKTPLTWSLLSSGSYSENNSLPSGWIGGGTAKNWRDDDNSWSLALPWSFSFYGTNYTSVNVCSNGYLDFTSTAADYSNSDVALKSAVRVAPLWDDLLTTGAGEDIFVTNTSDYVAVRWQAHTYSGNYPVNVEAVLYTNGDIRFNYGTAHSGLTPTIGISRGDNASYTLSSRNGAATIPADVSALQSFVPPLPPGLSLSSSGQLSGTPGAIGHYSFPLRVSDTSTPPQVITSTFSLEVYPQFGGTTEGGEVYYVKRDASGNVQVFDTNPPGATPIFSVAADSFSRIDFNTAGGNDELTIDSTNGDPRPSGGIAFNHGGGSDRLNLIGGSAIYDSDLGGAGSQLTLSITDAAVSFNADQHLAGLIIDRSGKADLKNHEMAIDYTGGTDPASSIKSYLASGYANGAWNGIGINTSSAIPARTGLGWIDDPSSSVLRIKYALYGDANLDGLVDISDLGILASHWQMGAVWAQGDFDYSDFVDISDLGLLATNWQQGTLSVPTLVPQRRVTRVSTGRVPASVLVDEMQSVPLTYIV